MKALLRSEETANQAGPRLDPTLFAVSTLREDAGMSAAVAAFDRWAKQPLPGLTVGLSILLRIPSLFSFMVTSEELPLSDMLCDADGVT